MLLLCVTFAVALTMGAPENGEEKTSAAQTEQALTLADVMQTFRTQGFDLLVAEAQVAGALGDARAAGAWANPQVFGSVSHAGRPYRAALCPLGQCSTTGFMVNLTDQAGLLDVALGKHHLRARSAQLAAEAVKYDLTDAHRELEAAVKLQFLAVALDQAELDFTVQASASYQKGQQLFADRYQAGDVSDADLTRVEIEVLMAQQREDLARANLEDDRAVLAMFMGHREGPTSFTVVAPNVYPKPAVRFITQPVQELLDMAATHRPDVMALSMRQASRQAALSLAERARLPDMTLNVNYQQFGIGQNAIQPRTYTGGLTLALPLLYQSQGEIARARADLTMASLRLEQARAKVALDVRRAQAALKYAHARSQRSSEGLVLRAAKALQLVRLQYTKGAASLLELLDAQRTFSQVNLDHLAALGEFWGAVIGLEQALGQEVQL